jgi:hypothetical protein
LTAELACLSFRSLRLLEMSAVYGSVGTKKMSAVWARVIQVVIQCHDVDTVRVSAIKLK